VVTLPFVVLLGLGISIGLLGLIGVLRPSGNTRDHSDVGRQRDDQRIGDDGRIRNRMHRLALPVAFGLLCVVVTRWPVAGLLGGLAFATLPSSLRKVLPGTTSKKTEAVATWTELIRDSLAASAGLSQAIVVTAAFAPIPIRRPVSALAGRLSNGVSLEAALRSFASEVDDPAAEFLVCALLLAATSRAQKLVEVLSALADSIREDVSMHLRIDASRASARSSVRTVVLFSLGFAGLLAVIGHSYLSPFGTATGQLVLALVGAFYGVGVALMVRLVQPKPEMRLLDGDRVA
jgi:tight adherence protein B